MRRSMPLDPEVARMCRVIEMTRCRGGRADRECDALAIEEPLDIRINDASIAITMRTPGSDHALAAGFAATEGFVSDPGDILDITHCAEPKHPDARNIVTVYIPPERMPDPARTARQRYANSSCGLCGRATIDAVRACADPVEAPVLSAHILRLLPDRLRAGQRAFEHTGGVHAAGLFDLAGNALFIEEDIGRHNTVDKVVGRALLEGRWPLTDTVLMVSGRAGFEIVQKALAARIPAVCAISAPSALAVDLAREAGMVLAGFVRGEAMNLYAGADRVQLPPG